MRRTLFIGLLLAGITLAIYWPARHYDLVYFDDPLFVTENADINSGLNWQSMKWAMTSVVAANWHPVTNLSFLLTHQFWGQNAGVEHLVNAVFHALNAALLFLLLNRVTGTTWRCAIVAALFAWHPLRVESVAWIAERKDVLSGFFFLLALLAYARYAKGVTRDGCQVTGIAATSRGTDLSVVTRHRSSFFWLALLFFVLGLMSKAMLVTLPFVLLLLDVWPLRRVTNDRWRVAELKKLALEKWPFFGVTAIFCGLTFVIQHTHAAMSSLDRLSFDARFSNVIASYLRYLAKTVWPTDLAVLYPFPINERSYLTLWADWQVAAALTVLVLVSWLCVRLVWSRPYLAFGWFWYLGTMLPVIGLVQVGGQGMADRYTYIPLIGPAISVVWWLAEWGGSNRLRNVFLGTTAVVILTLFTLATYQQLQYWKNTVNLFGRTVDITGENYLAHLALANGLEHQGRDREAATQYRVAIRMYPTDIKGYQGLASLLEKQQAWADAAGIYTTILGLEADEPNAHLGLANVLPHLGRKREAAEHLDAALRLNPASPDILNNLAWLLASSSEADLRDGNHAVALAERACKLTHYQKTIYIGTLAAAYAEAGRFDEAIATAQKACALAEAAGETGLLQKNRELLALYQTHQPYREATVVNPAAPAR